MPQHVPLKKLFEHQQGLGSDEYQMIEKHLAGCKHCTENMALFSPHLRAQKTKLATAHQRKPVCDEPADEREDGCPPPEQIDRFISNSLPKRQLREVEKHLAICNACRRQLIAAFQVSFEPVSEEEKNLLAALPPFEISEQVNAIKKLMPKKLGPLDIIRQLPGRLEVPVPGFGLLRPAWGIAIVAMLTLVVWASYRPFREWQGDRHARVAMTKLHKVWTITDDDFRPADDLTLSIFSQAHSPESTPGADTILAEFQQALLWDKENHSAQLGLATYWCFTGNLTQADSLLRAFMVKNPADAAAWNTLGLVAVYREDSTAALSAFEKALQLLPDYTNAAYNRANLLYHLSRWEEAKQAWQEYLKLDPYSQWANVAHARLRAVSSLQKK